MWSILGYSGLSGLPGLFWAVLGCSGLVWAVWAILGCLGCLGYPGLFWAILGGLFWAIPGCLGCSGLSWAVLGYSVSHGVQTLWPRSLKHQVLEKTVPKGSKSAPKWRQNPLKSNPKVTQKSSQMRLWTRSGTRFLIPRFLCQFGAHLGARFTNCLHLFTKK